MGEKPEFAPDIGANSGGGNPPDISGLLGAASRLLEGIAGLGDIAAKINEAAISVGMAKAEAQKLSEDAKTERSKLRAEKPLVLADIESAKKAALAAIRAAQGRGAYSNADNPNLQNPADMGYSSDRPQISPVLTE